MRGHWSCSAADSAKGGGVCAHNSHCSHAACAISILGCSADTGALSWSVAQAVLRYIRTKRSTLDDPTHSIPVPWKVHGPCRTPQAVRHTTVKAMWHDTLATPLRPPRKVMPELHSGPRTPPAGSSLESNRGKLPSFDPGSRWRQRLHACRIGEGRNESRGCLYHCHCVIAARGTHRAAGASHALIACKHDAARLIL